MLITAGFVIVNLPKSGSSFVRAVIKLIHRRRRSRTLWPSARDRVRELILPNIRLPGQARDQHGVVAQIPRRFRDRPIVSVLRDPYAKAVSEYRFRWWATHQPLPVDRLRTLFPAWPDLSFEEFGQLSDEIAVAKAGAAIAGRIGNLTVEFAQFFFAEPAAALPRLDDDRVRSGEWRRDLAPVEFLRHEALNGELAGFLQRHGYDADEVAACLAHQPVNVTAGEERNPWTAAALGRFRQRERLLFAMLDQLGFRYAAPLAIDAARQGDSAAAGS